MATEQWPGIELRHLAALIAVAHERSFRAAAGRLGYVPSAVSAQIALLERTAGVRLVERTRGPGNVTLTEAGEVLLAHAEAIMARLQAAQSDVLRFSDGAVRHLRIGITQSAGVRILPRLLQIYAERWPGVELRPREEHTDVELYQLVAQGELDLSFVELPAPEGPFETVRLMNDPYILVVRADSPVAHRRGPAELSDLTGLNLIGPMDSRGLRRVEAHLKARGVTLNFVVRSDVNATVQALVVAGLGAAIEPWLAVDHEDERTRIVELDREIAIPPRVIAIAWRRDRSHPPAARDLVSAAEGVCAELERTIAAALAPRSRR
jgi:DNA-binding transcriptional LysR family regulator